MKILGCFHVLLLYFNYIVHDAKKACPCERKSFFQNIVRAPRIVECSLNYCISIISATFTFYAIKSTIYHSDEYINANSLIA